MQFTKMQGCGNDYVYINCFSEKVDNPSELAVRLSERHFGIGSDGVILICPSGSADCMMDMYNLDGSRGKMCGNGIRCVGKYVYDHKITDKTQISVETLSGIKYLTLHPNEKTGLVDSVTVDMGAPVFAAEQIPLNTEYSGIDSGNAECIKDFRLEEAGRSFQFTFVSMGNPHAVTFIDDTASLDIEKYGPGLEKHSLFPEKANIEFIQVVSRNYLKMRVWERGSAETFACGTGACASVVAAVENGFADEHVSVELLGGVLEIFYDRRGKKVYMTGPAVEVFNGSIEV